jgi:hypothetical protein
MPYAVCLMPCTYTAHTLASFSTLSHMFVLVPLHMPRHARLVNMAHASPIFDSTRGLHAHLLLGFAEEKQIEGSHLLMLSLLVDLLTRVLPTPLPHPHPQGARCCESTVNSQLSTVNSQLSTVNCQQSTLPFSCTWCT